MGAVVSRDKLAAILGLLGSDFDGEVLAAARQAERIRRQMGVAWTDLLGEGPSPSDRAAPGMGRRPDTELWRDQIALCRRHRRMLNEWESAFVAELATYQRTPTPKQLAKLSAIAERVAAWNS